MTAAAPELTWKASPECRRGCARRIDGRRGAWGQASCDWQLGRSCRSARTGNRLVVVLLGIGPSAASARRPLYGLTAPTGVFIRSLREPSV